MIMRNTFLDGYNVDIPPDNALPKVQFMPSKSKTKGTYIALLFRQSLDSWNADMCKNLMMQAACSAFMSGGMFKKTIENTISNIRMLNFT